MRTAVLVTVAICAIAAPVHAQLPKPLPAAVVDLRGFYSGMGRDVVTATGLFPPVAPTLLPNRGVGGVVGLHVYVLRKKNLALGIGGEGVLMQGKAQETDATGLAVGETITQRLQGLSGQVSLNFGHRDGWSYVNAGMGPLNFHTFYGKARPAEAPPVQMTINLGAGARWFASRHFAFGFDLRFYQTEPEVQTASYPGRQRTRLRVLSGGISIR